MLPDLLIRVLTKSAYFDIWTNHRCVPSEHCRACMHPQGFVYCLRVAHPTSVSLLYFGISFRMSREHNQLEKQRETEEQKQFTWSFKFIKNGLARLTLRYKCIPCFRGIFRHFFSLWLSRTSHLFPLENNTIHTCIKRAFVRYFHAIQETIYISKIKNQ